MTSSIIISPLSQSTVAVDEAVNQNSACTVTATFLDATGAAFTPESAQYRLDEVEGQTQILGWTSLTPGTSIAIPITASQNAMVDVTRDYETHQCIVQYVTPGSPPTGGATDNLMVQWFVRRVLGLGS